MRNTMCASEQLATGRGVLFGVCAPRRAELLAIEACPGDDLVGLALALVAGVRNERFDPANTTRRGNDLRQTLPGDRAMNPTYAALLVTASGRNRSGAARVRGMRRAGWRKQD